MCCPVHSPDPAPSSSSPGPGPAPEQFHGARGFFRQTLESPPWSVVVLLVAADVIDRPLVTRALWAGIGLVTLLRAARRRYLARRDRSADAAGGPVA